MRISDTVVHTRGEGVGRVHVNDCDAVLRGGCRTTTGRGASVLITNETKMSDGLHTQAAQNGCVACDVYLVSRVNLAR